MRSLVWLFRFEWRVFIGVSELATVVWSHHVQFKSSLIWHSGGKPQKKFLFLSQIMPLMFCFFLKDGSYITWEHFVTTKYNFGAWGMFCCKQEEAVTSKSLTSAGCWHLQMSAFGRLLPTSLLLTSQCCSPVNYWHIVLRLSRGFYRHFSYGHSFEHQIRWLVYNLDFDRCLCPPTIPIAQFTLAQFHSAVKRKFPLKHVHLAPHS